MSDLIFENQKRLARKDIYLQILIGLGILLLVGLVSPIRNHGQPFSWTSFSFLAFSGVLLSIWIFMALRKTTLKAVEIKTDDGKVIFILARQLRDDKVLEFQLNGLHMDIEEFPDRSLPRKMILTITDNQTELLVSSRQKGLSERILNDIVEKLNHYPRQQP